MFPFGSLAQDWWKEGGPLDALRTLGALRMDVSVRTLGGEANCHGLHVLDIGCGGGMAAEHLARLGAHVTGVDPELSLIRAARTHANKEHLPIRYRHGTAEDVAGTFDLVLLLDVIEHVRDPQSLLRQAFTHVAPGGTIILTSVARTWKSWFMDVIAAEYLLGWVPRGTHDWNLFCNPSEVMACLEKNGLVPHAPIGFVYEAATGRWRESPNDLSGNWMLVAARPRKGHDKNPRGSS